MVHPHVDLPLPGVAVDPRFEEEVKYRLCEMMGWRNYQVFPGSQPVSLAREHLALFENEDYWVCEKSDGTRYLLLAVTLPQGPSVFLIDRKFAVRYVGDVILPLPAPSKGTHHETLLDGELVADIVNDEIQLKFLIFDLMFSNGTRLMDRPFTKRLGYCERDVIQPYQKALASRPDLIGTQPFIIEMKQMTKCYGLGDVFDQVIPNLKHGNDGLIFTPVNVHYVSGTCQKLLKWKPSWLNSVDFVLRVGNAGSQKDPFPVFELYIGFQKQLDFVDFLTPELSIFTQWVSDSPHERIVECRYDPLWTTYIPHTYTPPAAYSLLPSDAAQTSAPIHSLGLVAATDDTPSNCPPGFQKRTGGWRFLRFRDDKLTPNDRTVMEKIFMSIKDDVTPKDLLDRMNVIRLNWKAREQKAASLAIK